METKALGLLLEYDNLTVIDFVRHFRTRYKMADLHDILNVLYRLYEHDLLETERPFISSGPIRGDDRIAARRKLS